MNEKIERIYKLLDELTEATKDAFPEYSRVSTVCDSDGYRSLTILKWGEGETAAATPRRVLLTQSKINGKLGRDYSDYQNQYYKDLGLLLED